MSINFDALRKKLNTLQGQNNRSSALWKPSKGKSTIRIVPWKERPDNPFIELYFHYLGRKTQLSPITNSKPDPIAEFADKLRQTGDKDDWKFARQFSPKLRTYVPVVVRGEEDKGVRLWGFGKTVYEQLLLIIDDDDWGDITNVENGFDVGVEFTPEKESKTNYAETKILMKRKSTPLSDDAEKLKGWLITQPDIGEIYEEPTYDELATYLERYLNPESDVSVTAQEKAPSDDGSKETSDKAEAKVEALLAENDDDGSPDSSDVSEEFAKLFNE